MKNVSKWDRALKLNVNQCLSGKQIPFKGSNKSYVSFDVITHDAYIRNTTYEQIVTQFSAFIRRNLNPNQTFTFYHDVRNKHTCFSSGCRNRNLSNMFKSLVIANLTDLGSSVQIEIKCPNCLLTDLKCNTELIWLTFYLNIAISAWTQKRWGI